MSLSPFITPLTFEVAIILIFKHAALLCLSGTAAKRALTQAESDFQKANIMSRVQEHFTASYEEYTIEQVEGFLMNTDIGLSTFAST